MGAALAARGGIAPRAVPIADLQRVLAAQGVYLRAGSSPSAAMVTAEQAARGEALGARS